MVGPSLPSFILGWCLSFTEVYHISSFSTGIILSLPLFFLVCPFLGWFKVIFKLVSSI